MQIVVRWECGPPLLVSSGKVYKLLSDHLTTGKPKRLDGLSQGKWFHVKQSI